MLEDCQRDKDCQVGGFDGNLEVPEDEVTALCVVVVPKAGDHAPSPTQILVVLVGDGAHLGAKVDSECAKGRVGEWVFEGWVCILDF